MVVDASGGTRAARSAQNRPGFAASPATLASRRASLGSRRTLGPGTPKFVFAPDGSLSSPDLSV